MQPTDTHLDIDGDVLRYRIGFACEEHRFDVYIKGEEEQGRFASFVGKTELNAWLKDKNKEDFTIEETVVPEPIENCLHSVKLQIQSMINACKATSYTVYLSGKGNFREDLVDYYKANRKDARKPLHYDTIGNYLIEHWGAVVINGQEADDALGISQYSECLSLIFDKGEINPQDCRNIICSIDKDLKNIPGWNYNFVDDKLEFIDEHTADINFYSQLIEGDTADNIPGFYKITGARLSAKLFEPLLYCDTEEEMWEYVYSLYCNEFTKIIGDDDKDLYSGLHRAVAVKLREIGRLLWIRRLPNQLWDIPI